MTVKRDLKRRVRERQARTGEAYVTARRHVVAARGDDPEDPDDADGPDDSGDPGNDDSETAASPVEAEPAAGEADPAAPPEPLSAQRERVEPPASPEPLSASRERLEPPAPPGPAAGEANPAAAPPEPLSAPREGVEPRAPLPPLFDGLRKLAEAPAAAVPVVELVDVTADARRAGLVCRVAMFPGLARRVEPAGVLARLRALLVETTGDPQASLLCQVALTGYAQRRPARPTLSTESVRRFIRRAIAGLGGISEDGTALAFHVADRDGIVPVLCSLSGSGLGLELSAIDDLTAEPWNHIAARGAAIRLLGPMLFVIHDGRWHPVSHDEFVIGRRGQGVHLAIEDGTVSSHHAVVIRRNGSYYLKDLESPRGIYYKGMRIDNKRIDEGDVFQIGDHELRFSFQPERPDD